MRIATIDVGTNTAQLLVAEADDEGIEHLHTAERFVRLGEGVDARNRIGPAAQHRLLTTLREYCQLVRRHDVDRVVGEGTSALRDAANRQEILTLVEEELGWSFDVLSGAEEAAWSFAAACDAFDAPIGTCLVVDVGGGSTELIAGTNPTRHRPKYPNAIDDRVSVDLGCVRLTERFFDHQPPSPNAIEAVERLIDDTLSTPSLSVGDDATLIGTAGTATALALIHAGPKSTGENLRGAPVVLHRDDIRHWRDRLLRLPVEDIRALHPKAMAGRADVFPIGVLLLDRILRYYDRPHLRVSPYELRHGLALRACARSPFSP